MKLKPEMLKYEVKPGHIYAIREEALDLKFEVSRDRSSRVEGGIGILTVYGPLDHHASGPFDNYDEILSRYTELCEEEDAEAIVLEFDSPGGDAYGMIEARKMLMKLAAKYDKPTYAYSNESCFSAAYGLASACSEIWLPETGGVGSIGVVRPVMDQSEAFKRQGIKAFYICSPPGKGLGRPGLPIDDATQARIQSEVDQFAALFFKGVSKARGISIDDIHSLKADTYHGKRALKAGIADGIAGWEDFLSMVRNAHGITPSTKATINRSSSASTQEPTDMKAKKAAKTLLALMAKKTETLAALAGSKSTDERKTLAATLDGLIAQIQTATQASYKKTKKVEETEERSDDEDEEEEESAEEEESEEEEQRMDDDEDDDDDDDSSVSTGSSVDEKAEATFLSSKSGLQTPARLLRLCKQVTGKENIGEVFGALDAMGIRLKSAAKTEKRVAKLELINTKTKVNALLAKAKDDGRVSPAQVQALREQGMKDPSWLKGYLATLAPKVNQDEVEYDLSSQSQAPSMADQVAMLGGGTSGVPLTDQQKILQAATTGLNDEESKLFANIQSKALDKANSIFNGTTKVGPRF